MHVYLWAVEYLFIHQVISAGISGDIDYADVDYKDLNLLGSWVTGKSQKISENMNKSKTNNNGLREYLIYYIYCIFFKSLIQIQKMNMPLL